MKCKGKCRRTHKIKVKQIRKPVKYLHTHFKSDFDYIMYGLANGFLPDLSVSCRQSGDIRGLTKWN